MELAGRLELHAKDATTLELHGLAQHITEAAACIREMVEWRDIETAPRDGTVILGWSSFFPKRRPVEVAWDADRYALRPVPRWVARDSAYSRRAFFDHPLTHWLPLPPAPGAEDE